MTNDDAKFILRTYRSDGRYQQDSLFREALERAHRDPALMRWLASEQALDETVARKLEQIPPPTGLREAILVGGRASRRREQQWWRRPTWLAAAAALAIVAVLPFIPRGDPAETPPITVAQLAQFGIDDMIANHADHAEFAFAPELEPFQSKLTSYAEPYSSSLEIDVAALETVACRTIGVEGLTVHELCFLRDGTWFHLYVVPAAGNAAAADGRPVFAEHDGYASASWVRNGCAYIITAHKNIKVLRRYV